MYSPVLLLKCRYGAHLTREQVDELAAPHPHTLELVRSWLIHHSVPFSSFSRTHGNTLTFTNVSIIQANKLLGASYQLYKHVKTNETIVRTIGYALPAVLHKHVWTVAPTTHFDTMPTGMRRQTLRKHSHVAAAKQAEAVSEEPVTALSSRDNFVTSPSFLSRLYNTWGYTPTATYRNMLAIVGYLWDYPSPSDLRAFMEKYRTGGADGTYTVVQVNYGGYDPSHPNGEANAAIQYAQGMAYPTPLVFYSTGRGPEGTDDWYLSWLFSVLSLLRLPRTISTSYFHHEMNFSRRHAEYLCYLYAQLGARGVSVLFALEMAAWVEGTVSLEMAPSVHPLLPRKLTQARVPGSLPVGGTTGFQPEWGWDFSGGGFSDYFERPIYQQRAVATFFQDLGTHVSGRGIPDVAAQATGLRFFVNGIEVEDSGTSVATPPPLGFLNPWLYGGGLAGLNDITRGSNPGCGTPGFSAIVGWDPVTGLGTPDFRRLQQTLVNQAG
ncbi:peptidase S8/S53 domain-containing protein [Lactarius quietus]|nr:peptidase S8/S53 domain-containing protein [Lactarius quietus]